MNKARMTIRFDHETPKGQGGGSGRETERESLQSEFGPRIEEPVEIMNKHSFTVYDNNQTGNPRANGRLAEERRRLEQQRDDHLYFDDGYEGTEAPYRGGSDPDLTPMNDWEMDQQNYFHGTSEEGDRNKPYLFEGGSSNDYGYYRSRKPTSVWKVAGSITGAIVTGVLFGAVVLSMFNDGDSDQAPNTSEIGSQATDSQSSGNASVNESLINEETTGEASVVVAVPQQTFYMLQYGVFSSAERAEQAKGELTQSGIAAFGDSSPENRVYAGVSPDREQAKLLSSQLKNEGVELYVREITLPGAQSAVFAGEAAALDIFFEMSGELTDKLSSLSASLLGLESPGPVDAETMNTITGLHLQWTEAVKLAASGLSPEIGAGLTSMEQEMNGAITALTEYNKNRSKGHLWEIQAGMMNYIMGQRKLVESL